MYTAFSAGAELNPDPPGSDDEGMGDFFFDEEEVKANLRMPDVTESLASVAIHTHDPLLAEALSGSMADGPEPDARFADAEESEEEGDEEEDEEMPQDGA
jgi:hypothetical protein